MNDPQTLEVRLTGPEVTLASVPARDWLGVVDALVAALQSGGGPETSLVITGIGDGSVVVRMRALSGDVGSAWQTIRDAIQEQKVQRLPGVARAAVGAAVRFARQHAGQVELRDAATPEPVTVIRGDTPLLGPGILRETTIIYGRVYRVGGAEPRIGLEVDPDGERIACACSMELAQRVAPLLYQRVGLWGEAKWDPETWTLAEFDAKDLSEYRDRPIAEGLAALAAIVGEDRWGDDLVEAVRALRSDEP